MAEIKFTGIEEVLKSLKKEGENIRKLAARAMENVAIDNSVELKGKVQAANKIDLANYQKSIRTSKPVINKNEVIVEIFTLNEYADIIEEGRRPDQKPPPIKALVGWAARKNITSTITVTTNIGSGYDDEWKAAFGVLNGRGFNEEKVDKGVVDDLIALISISRAIGKRGIKGAFLFEKQTLELNQTMLNDVAKYLKL